MILHASHNQLVLTSMNQARTAFCSITFKKTFFSKFGIADADNASSVRIGRSRHSGEDGVTILKWQLQTKVSPRMSSIRPRKRHSLFDTRG